MVSLLNGLSSMGAGVASFAGTAGLEAQKADLLQQQTVLADQLATTRESKGRQEQATINTAAAAAEHQFLGEQGAAQRATQVQTAQIGASASLGAAGISAAASEYAANMQSKNVYAQIASAEPEQQARILAQNQQTALMQVQTQNQSDLRDAHTALQQEEGQDNPDPARLATLKSRVTSLETSAGTEAAISTAAANMYHTDMQNVDSLNGRMVAATAALNSPEMSDTGKAQQRAVIAALQKQLQGAQLSLQYSSALVHGRIGSATGTAPASPGAPSGGPARPPLSSFGGANPPPDQTAGPRAQPQVAPTTLPSLLNGSP